ncbi:hypothetical protein EON67_04755, partial [archaeon]
MQYLSTASRVRQLAALSRHIASEADDAEHGVAPRTTALQTSQHAVPRAAAAWHKEHAAGTPPRAGTTLDEDDVLEHTWFGDEAVCSDSVLTHSRALDKSVPALVQRPRSRSVMRRNGNVAAGTCTHSTGSPFDAVPAKDGHVLASAAHSRYAAALYGARAGNHGALHSTRSTRAAQCSVEEAASIIAGATSVAEQVYAPQRLGPMFDELASAASDARALRDELEVHANAAASALLDGATDEVASSLSRTMLDDASAMSRTRATLATRMRRFDEKHAAQHARLTEPHGAPVDLWSPVSSERDADAEDVGDAASATIAARRPARRGRVYRAVGGAAAMTSTYAT